MWLFSGLCLEVFSLGRLRPPGPRPEGTSQVSGSREKSRLEGSAHPTGTSSHPAFTMVLLPPLPLYLLPPSFLRFHLNSTRVGQCRDSLMQRPSMSPSPKWNPLPPPGGGGATSLPCRMGWGRKPAHRPLLKQGHHHPKVQPAVQQCPCSGGLCDRHVLDSWLSPWPARAPCIQASVFHGLIAVISIAVISFCTLPCLGVYDF